MKELRISVTIAVPDDLFGQATALAAIQPHVETFSAALQEVVSDSEKIVVTNQLVGKRVGGPRGPRKAKNGGGDPAAHHSAYADQSGKRHD